MSSIEKLVRTAAAGPAMAFRERAYGKVERQGLVRDVLGLANALVDGPRYLVLGVRDGGFDGRELVGVSETELEDAREFYQQLINRFIEPALTIDLNSAILDGALIAILALNHCDDPPYLVSENVSNTMREGSGWIRHSTEPLRLRRSDLMKLFEKSLLSSPERPAISVGFAGDELSDELSLKVLDLAGMPSRVESAKLRKLMEVKQVSRNVAGESVTRIERLVHAREFGSTQPYRQTTESSLIRRLGVLDADHQEADEYYEFELRAHKVAINLANGGDAALDAGTLTLDFPLIEGLGVADRIRVPPGSGAEPPPGYPTVEKGQRKIRIQTAVPSVPAGATVAAFSQPLRVWVREPLSGKTLPVQFSLQAKNLNEPLTGTLRIHVRAE